VRKPRKREEKACPISKKTVKICPDFKEIVETATKFDTKTEKGKLLQCPN